MQITLLTVGKIKEKYLKDAINEYLKRMQSYAKVEIIEVADEKEPYNPSLADELIVKSKEGERLKAKLKDGTFLIALAIDGEELSSPKLAKKIENLTINGHSHITFLIGGSLGIEQSLLDMADYKLSFSKLTFPHQLMRVILLEQIYRSFRIIKGEPYHK